LDKFGKNRRIRGERFLVLTFTAPAFAKAAAWQANDE